MTEAANTDAGAIRNELAALDEAFADIKVEDDTGPVPDGRWQGTIKRAILTRATSTRPMIEWEIVVATEGQQAGKSVIVRWVITNNTLEWIKKALHALGLRIVKISTVADHLPQIINASIDFTIKTKEERRKVYFNRRLDGGGADGDEREDKTIIEDFLV